MHAWWRWNVFVEHGSAGGRDGTCCRSIKYEEPRYHEGIPKSGALRPRKGYCTGLSWPVLSAAPRAVRSAADQARGASLPVTLALQGPSHK